MSDIIPESHVERRNLIRWLKDHPVWNHPVPVTLDDGQVIHHGCFSDLVSIDIAYVNPEDNTVSDEDTLNVLPEVWIEAGPYVNVEQDFPELKYMPSHDYRLDCGGPTLEIALCELALLVKAYYGHYKAQTD